MTVADTITDITPDGLSDAVRTSDAYRHAGIELSLSEVVLEAVMEGSDSVPHDDESEIFEIEESKCSFESRYVLNLVMEGPLDKRRFQRDYAKAVQYSAPTALKPLAVYVSGDHNDYYINVTQRHLGGSQTRIDVEDQFDEDEVENGSGYHPTELARLADELIDETKSFVEMMSRSIYEYLRDEIFYRGSDEVVDDNIRANEYEFDEEGNRDEGELQFDELDDSAKERARDWYRESDDQDVSDSADQIKEALEDLGWTDVEVWYRISFSQGDEASFTGYLLASQMMRILDSMPEYTVQELFNRASRLNR